MRGSHDGCIEEVAHQDRRPQVNHRNRSQVEQKPCGFPHENGYRAADGQTNSKIDDGQTGASKAGARRLEFELNSYLGLGSFEKSDDWQYIRVNELI